MLDKHGDHLKSVCVKTVNVISAKVFFQWPKTLAMPVFRTLAFVA